MDNEFDSELGSLVDQLQESNKAVTHVHSERDPLKKENLEKFVIEKAGALVEESLDMMRVVKEYIVSAPENKDVEALAGLISATSSAIETLNKIIVTDKRTENAIKLKQLDGENRRAVLEGETQQKILLSREEVLKEIALRTDEKRINSIVIEPVN